MTRLLHRGALTALLLGLVTAVPVGMAAPASAAPITDLTLTLTSSPEPESGQMVSFTGTGPRALRGARIKLMRRVDGEGSWVKVAESRIQQDKTYAISGVATGVGINTWKTVSTKNRVKHVSRPTKTTVFGWYYLSEQEEVDGTWDMYGDSAAIGGVPFSKSVVASGYGSGYSDWIEYNLSYRCQTFAASVGVDDASQTGYQAALSVYLDGAQTSLGTHGLGPATDVTIGVASRLRIKLEVTHVEDPDWLDGYGAFGNARVLCSGTP